MPVPSSFPGRLMVDFVKDKDLVWRGIADNIMVTMKPEKNTKKINKAITKLFKKYPPPEKN